MPVSPAIAGFRLTLVRHGRAESPAVGQSDLDRVLDSRGLAEVARMAQRCLDVDLVPQQLLASPALRTRQTATALASAFGLPADRLQIEHGLYLAGSAALLESVRATAAQVRHLMLVGHNPGLAELAHWLAPGARVGEFATAATFTMWFELGDWQDLRRGAAREARYEAPGQASGDWA